MTPLATPEPLKCMDGGIAVMRGAAANDKRDLLIVISEMPRLGCVNAAAKDISSGAFHLHHTRYRERSDARYLAGPNPFVLREEKAEGAKGMAGLGVGRKKDMTARNPGKRKRGSRAEGVESGEAEAAAATEVAPTEPPARTADGSAGSVDGEAGRAPSDGGERPGARV